jgi:hypothetical protein
MTASAAGLLVPIAVANADLVFDNASGPLTNTSANFSSGVGGLYSSSTNIADTFIGGVIKPAAGTSEIYGFEAFPINLTSATTFTDIKLNVYFWGTVNPSVASGLVSTSTPAFSNLLGEESAVVDYAADGATGLPPDSIGTPGGASADPADDPYGAFILSNPIAVPVNSSIGVTVNCQGSTDGGNTYNSIQMLTTPISYNAPPTNGSTGVNGNFRNRYNSGHGTAIGSAETNGNFVTNLINNGLTDNTGPLLRLYGVVGPATADNWLSTSGGIWTDTTKWSNAALPSPGVAAVFNLSSASTYTVQVQDERAAKSVSVLNDNVEFDLNALESYLFTQNALSVGVAPTAGGTANGNLTVYNSGRFLDNSGNPVFSEFEASSVVVGGNGGTGTLTITPYAYIASDNDTAINAHSSIVLTGNPQVGGELITNTLTIAGTTNAWTGKLDIGPAVAVIGSGNLATVTNQIKSGYNGGTWTGQGITSSTAATDTTHLTAVGAVASGSEVIVEYTYYGDANLDGQVDGADYTLIDNGFLNHLTGWGNGDFNYDGIINGSDYTLIDNVFNMEGENILTGDAPDAILPDLAHRSVLADAASRERYISSGDVSELTSEAGTQPADGPESQSSANPTATITSEIAGATVAVPEPTSVGSLALAGSALLARRTRRNCPCQFRETA